MTQKEMEIKAKMLVEQMTIEEAASQLLYTSPAIERLEIPEYNWWNEALHGVARAGTATVFPQAIGMAASFDDTLLEEVFSAVSTEARAKYNAVSALGDRDIYKGLTFWTPNINIFRDPRWGRGHETYGEDPYLTMRMGNAAIRGLQGDGKYLKTAACAKHFAVHSGPENLRHEFNAVVSPKDMAETYLPAFESAVKDAHVESVMGAYNRVNGEPCCGSKRLLKTLLRDQWGFDGYVVSDCWAVRDFHENHKVTETPAQSASLALSMGCDINCGCTYEHLLKGVREGLISEKDIRRSAFRALLTRMKLGVFDKDCEYDAIPYEAIGAKEHVQLALKMAEESAVLLKNDGILPLNRDSVKSIAVIGPNAYRQIALFGNYHGDSAEYVTNLDGIRRLAGENIRIFYSAGCHVTKKADDFLARPERLMSEAISAAKAADVVILCMGLDSEIEGEQGDAGNADAAGDRISLMLPEVQQELCRKVMEVGKPVILVLNSGSCLDIHEFEAKSSAIMQCWYSGEQGGTALANLLFGITNPSGKLPLTFYYNDQPMPAFTDYSMQNRTYRYVKTKMLYPFGYGLSYVQTRLHHLELFRDGEAIRGSIQIKNEGIGDTDEVIQIYLRYQGEAFEKPSFSLCWFGRVHIEGNEEKEVKFRIGEQQLKSVLENGERRLLPGIYTIYAGTNAPDERSTELTGKYPLSRNFCVEEGQIRIAQKENIPSDYVVTFPEKFVPKEIVPRKKARYSTQSPLCDLLRNPDAWALITSMLPELDSQMADSTLRTMPIPFADMMSYSGKKLEEDMTAKLDAELEKIG